MDWLAESIKYSARFCNSSSMVLQMFSFMIIDWLMVCNWLAHIISHRMQAFAFATDCCRRVPPVAKANREETLQGRERSLRRGGHTADNASPHPVKPAVPTGC